MNEMTETPEQQDAILEIKLTKDLRAAAGVMQRNQARYLIGIYLSMQASRKASDQKIARMEKRGLMEPHSVLEWASEKSYAVEKQILAAINMFAESEYMGRWAMGIFGVGPVVAAGLLAHIDMNSWKCAHVQDQDEIPCNPDAPHGPECKHLPIQTAGQIWRFAGFDPTAVWEKGEKRPHNAALKQICYYAGESFIKGCNNPKSVFGKLFKDRKAFEWQRNLSGGNAEQCPKELAKKKFKKSSNAYKWLSGLVDPDWARECLESGKPFPESVKVIVGKPFPMLPPAQIHARARRHSIKLFLSAWHAEAYRHEFSKEPPAPFAIASLGHAHYIDFSNVSTYKE